MQARIERACASRQCRSQLKRLQAQSAKFV
jgi:hypothetical protein